MSLLLKWILSLLVIFSEILILTRVMEICHTIIGNDIDNQFSNINNKPAKIVKTPFYNPKRKISCPK